MTEYIRVFNEKHEWLRIVSRDEAHAQGLWHETFHCWLYDEAHLYFQLRSPLKKDYPNLFDITAAGHLLATETPEDGLREVAEEIGIMYTIKDVKKMGIVACEIISPHMIDREFCHVFLARAPQSFSAFTLQAEEVAGIVKAKLIDVAACLNGESATFFVDGFEEIDGTRQPLQRDISLKHIVGFREQYVQQVIQYIQQHVAVL